jgi:acyl carrier protein
MCSRSCKVNRKKRKTSDMSTDEGSPDLRPALREIVARGIGMPVSGVDDRASLLSSGLLDSLAIIDLLLFVYEATGVAINPGEFNRDDYDSIERIIETVRLARD